MSILLKLAGASGRRDEGPNKDLGRQLVADHDIDGIREVAENLHSADRRVRIDCLSVLEQVGLLEPDLIEDYAPGFLELVFSRDNRLVWAAMIDLALVAGARPGEIYARFDDIAQVIDRGSVITKDNGIKVLAQVGAADDRYRQAIMPYLLGQLQTCRAKSVPQYAESIRIAVDAGSQVQYLGILHERSDELSAAQRKRVTRLIETL